MSNCWVNKEQDRHPGTHLHAVRVWVCVSVCAESAIKLLLKNELLLHPKQWYPSKVHRLCKRKKKEEPRRQ
eukprot:802305-Pelagomonas_calceolata.AAC.1